VDSLKVENEQKDCQGWNAGIIFASLLLQILMALSTKNPAASAGF